MTKVTPYPLFFTPIYKDYIWGGNRISQVFDRTIDTGICAESWEVADRPEGMSTVSEGPLTGISLHELIVSMGKDLLGTHVLPSRALSRADASSDELPAFPLLTKIIDARQRLSVQVHPDDRAAAKYGGEAKAEMWYVLDADRDARVFAGLIPGTDRTAFGAALKMNRLEDILCSIPVRRGQAIYIPGGRVHSIGEGCLLLEIQQNSNTTYRVYDWGRLDKDGGPRELHIAEALRVIDWSDPLPEPVQPVKLGEKGGNSYWEIITCPHFHVLRSVLSSSEKFLNDRRTFHIIFIAEGTVDIEGGGIVARKGPGTSCLIPAVLETYGITPAHGPASIIRISAV